MTTTQTYTHPTLPLSGSRDHWTALGYDTYADFTVRAMDPRHDADLILAIDATGDHGEHALAWALAERRRRQESRARVDAIKSEAKAIIKLADAIRSETDQATMERVMSRLTEKTRWAVRSQLAGGMLSS